MLGKSGCGKSTLLFLLSLLESPDEGEVLLNQESTKKWNEERRSQFHSQDIGMVFQRYNLLETLSVLDNVLLPSYIGGKRKEISKKEAFESLEAFGLKGMEKRIAKDLSGGEKQRLAIARARANDPSVLLADEPTGALDSDNARQVMFFLHEESKKRLVILVTHNEELAYRYADGIIRFEEGKVYQEKTCSIEEGKEFKNIAKRHKNAKWRGIFVRNNLNKHRLKNAICLFSGGIGLSLLLISFGFLNGNKEAMENNAKRSLEYPLFSVSRKSLVPLANSPLTLYKQTRPSQLEIDDCLDGIEDYSIENDYSYFLPKSTGFSLDGEKQDPVSFLPVFDLPLREGNSFLLSKGELPTSNSLEECLVNEEFMVTYPAQIGSVIHFENKVVVEEGKEKEELLFDYRFKILASVKEHGFLNRPKVYYSYLSLREKMREIELENIRGPNGERLNLEDIVSEAEEDHYLSSYAYWVFVHDLSKVGQIANAQGELAFYSSPKEASDSFLALSEALSSSLWLFSILGMLEVSLILGMTCYSNYLDERRDCAILKVLGAREKDIKGIYGLEALAIGTSSAILALCLSPILAKGLNAILLAQFDMEKIISLPLLSYFGIPLLLPILLIAAAALISLLSSYLPLWISARAPLGMELREE